MEERPRLYTSLDVLDATGVSYRQLDYWDRTGVVRPTRPACGSGSTRGYTVDDAVNVALVAAISDAGGGLPRNAREAIAAATASNASLVLVRSRLRDYVHGGSRRETEVIPVPDVQTLLDELREGPATVVDVGSLRANVTEILDRKLVAA